MKKLFNSRFLFILASSIVVLIGLTIGAFYLFDDVDDTFVKSGYVLNPLSSTSEKYYFDENAGYRENLSSMIEFEDVDKNKVSILKDSFVHYTDESMSFLKNGAILDLDSLSGDNVVAFYNITDKSVIEKDGNGYTIESSNGDINLDNFIGRISDNKYIVVGDLSLKVAGNNTTVKGDYFEIVYVEEGVVNVENKDVKYQVAADDTLIYVGNDKVVDLGDKKITLNGEDIMSITSITIDGDENIEIIPKAEEEDDDEEEENDGDGQGENAGNEQTNPDVGNNQEQDGGTGNEGTTGEATKELEVRLKSAEISSVDITTVFDIYNATDEDVFRLQVINLSTGRSVELPVSQVVSDYPNNVSDLTPATNYLFSVVNEKDNNKYFQKVLTTKTFGIELEKSYATDNSLSFKISVDENSDVKNAKLTLYYFDEEEMTLKPVEITETDENGVEVTKEYSKFLVENGENVVGEHNKTFGEPDRDILLDSNTIYTAVLNDFVLLSNNINWKENYEMSVSAMTLKKTPDCVNMNVNINTDGTDADGGKFELFIGDISDPDNAIMNYTYKVYEIKKDGEVVEAIDPIVQQAASPISIPVGSKGSNTQLAVGKDYYYEVIVEYFDNEKYIEYVEKDKVSFGIEEEVYVTVVEEPQWISYDTLGGYIYLSDLGCKYPLPDREKLEGEDCYGFTEMEVVVEEISDNLGDGSSDVTSYYRRQKIDNWTVNGREVKAEFKFDGLNAGTKYSVNVYVDGEDFPLNHGINSKDKISTKDFAKLGVKWSPQSSNDEEVPIMMNTKLIVSGSVGKDDLSVEETVSAIDKIVIKMYDGENVNVNSDSAVLIDSSEFYNTSTFNIKENFFDNEYKITNTDTFDLNRATLDALSTDGKLNYNYTFLIEAYSGDRKIQLVGEKRNYKVSPSLFNSAKTEKKFEPVSHSAESDLFVNLNNTGTVIGFDMRYRFDRISMDNSNWQPISVNYYVYNANGDPVKFLVKDEESENKLVEVEFYSQDISEEGFDGLWDSDEVPFRIYLDYGTIYEEIDDLFRRGNKYYIGYEINYKLKDSTDKTEYPYPLANDGTSPSGYGMYEEVTISKESPSLKMYIASSTADSITYDYQIKDPDNSIYKEFTKDDYYFYYIVGNGVQQEIAMEKNEEITEFNQFEGRLTLPGLSNGVKYELYYKKSDIKTGVVADDIVKYLDGTDVSKIFDGYYDASENIDNYKFQYEIINNPLTDNKIVIKIKAKEEILDRILSYNLTFKSVDENGVVNTIEKNLWKLETCQGDRADAVPRCLSVGYNELKNENGSMKSEQDNKKIITINVDAVYDNGLIGMDFVTNNADKPEEERYCILQENVSSSEVGRYISFDGNQIYPRDNTSDYAIGYNICQFTSKTRKFIYTSKLNSSKATPVLKLGNSGYYSTDQNYPGIVNTFLNPKMVSIDTMSCTGNNCDGISFDVIVPKVDVKDYKSLLNGSWKKLSLSGISINDIKKEEDGKRYLYVKVWDNKIDADNENMDKIVGTIYKGEIVSENDDVIVKIEGLKELNEARGTGEYYFNVYADLISEGKIISTRLPDENNEGFVTEVYKLESLMASDVLKSIKTSNVNIFKSEEEFGYGKRTLNFNIYLDSKKELNFDLIYVLCKIGDVNCSPDSESSLLTKSVSNDKVKSGTITDNVDVYNKIDIEYGNQYNINLYAVLDYYDPEDNNKLTKQTIWLNEYTSRVDLDTGVEALDEPTFSADRYTIFEKNEDGTTINGFKFEITANDPDKTLVDGKYNIQLRDYNDSSIIFDESDGIKVYELDDDGAEREISNYLDYDFDATVGGKVVKVIGLEEDKTYELYIYGDAYVNNYNSSSIDVSDTVELPDGLVVNKDKIVLADKDYPVHSSNEFGVSFGTMVPSTDGKNITIKFYGGTSLGNITKIRYLISSLEGTKHEFRGVYTIGVDGANIGDDGEHKSFVIKPDGELSNVLYRVSVNFTINDPNSDDVIELYPGETTWYYEEFVDNRK